MQQKNLYTRFFETVFEVSGQLVYGDFGCIGVPCSLELAHRDYRKHSTWLQQAEEIEADWLTCRSSFIILTY